MESYEKLTLRGQVRRLRRIAWEALAQYDLQIHRVALLGWYTNLMFRVETDGGGKFVLRICAPDWRTGTDLKAEVGWLLALARDTDIGAPIPQPTRQGEYIVHAAAEGVPGVRRCILMSWVPGVNLGKHLEAGNLQKMGLLFARMHSHTAHWDPPPGFSSRRMDRVLAREEPDVLFSETAAPAFTPQTRSTWEEVRRVVQETYARRYAMPGLQVIHHDLWHDNIKLSRGRLHPLDFEDTVWGYSVQDIAMAMQDLMQDVPPGAYEPLLRAFRLGYERFLPWPEAYEGEVDTFRAGRMLWVANYVAHMQRQYLQEHLEHFAPMLENFLGTRKLRKTDRG